MVLNSTPCFVVCIGVVSRWTVALTSTAFASAVQLSAA
jgi:hypothetical protein